MVCLPLAAAGAKKIPYADERWASRESQYAVWMWEGKRRMKRLSKIMKSRHSIEMANQKDVAVKIE